MILSHLNFGRFKFFYRRHFTFSFDLYEKTQDRLIMKVADDKLYYCYENLRTFKDETQLNLYLQCNTVCVYNLIFSIE